MVAFKWLWEFLRKFKFRLLIAFILATSVAFINMINPYVQGRIVDDVITDGKNYLLITYILIMVGAILLKSVIRYTYQYIFEFVSQSVIFNIREKIYSRLQILDFAFFDKTKTGDIMTRMTGDLEAVRHFTAWVMFGTFFNSLTFITVMVILFTINFRFALLLLIVTPFICFFTLRLATTVKPAFAAIRQQFANLNSVVQENISGNRVVKAFAKEDYEIEKFMKENLEFRQKNIDAAKVWEKYLPVLDSLAGTLSVVIILAGGIMVINNSITLGELITFNGYIWALNNPMRMAGWLVNDIQRFAASGEKIMALLETEPRIENPENPIVKEKFDGEVEFRNVSFSYGEEKVLEDISFKANPGQIIAVVGPTGSGKSTLTSLISRFYDCTGGEVLIDGVNVKKYDIKRLRRNVAVAMQDVFLFSDTIEGNIAYGVPEADMKEVERSAEIAHAHDFISGFPEGYDTIIGERGVGLSGGQRQRIALARALVKDPAILILDDTTSSVDMETEFEIQKALKTVFRDKTTFIIAHRISSVKNADMILVLNDGRIVERGKHDELLAGKGYYYSVYISQCGDFESAYEEEVV